MVVMDGQVRKDGLVVDVADVVVVAVAVAEEVEVVEFHCQRKRSKVRVVHLGFRRRGPFASLLETIE